MSVTTATLPVLTGPMPDKLAISRFSAPATTSVKPLRQELPWPELTALLSTHERRTYKDGRGWSFATYRKGTTRSNKTVEATAGLGGDVDHATFEDYGAIVARLEELDLAFVIYSTFSNNPPDDVCFRVVLPFTTAITGDTTITALEQYRLVWTRANHHIFGGRLDVQAKDLSRMLYWPAAPPEAAVFAKIGEGLALDWQALPPAPNQTASASTNDTVQHRGEIKQIGRAAAQFIAFGADNGKQRGTALATGRNLLAAGYSIEDTTAKLWQGFQNSRNDPAKPAWTEADALQIATSLANSEPTPPEEFEGIDLYDAVVAMTTAGVKPAQPTNPALRTNGTNGTVHVEEIEPPAQPPAPVDPPTEQQSRSFPLTDLGNSERLVDRFGDDIRYYPALGKWLTWDGKRWREDTVGRIYRLAKQTVRLIYQEAAEADSDTKAKELAKHAIKSEGKERIKAMVELAQSELPVEPHDLDADTWLLNLQNGTLDLRTGLLHEHRREELITKLAPVVFDPAADCPTWRAFLRTIMADSEDQPKRRLIAYLRRMLGYSLTASTAEQAIFLLWGGGSNGKSTFLETVRAALGDYAQQADFSTFLYRDYDRVSNDIARLKGTRFVSAVEVEGTRRLAETLVKQLTGGDMVTARFLFREFFEFKPAFKILLAANHKPQIRGSDWAIWRRIRLVPFTVTIAEKQQDKKLPQKLRAELPGILNWMIRGCLLWQRKGLGMADEIREATNEYREEMDILGPFLAERCEMNPTATVPAKDLYKAYTEWAEQNGEAAVKQSTFGTRLTERGIQRGRVHGGKRVYVGIRLAPSGDTVTCGDVSPGQKGMALESYEDTSENTSPHVTMSPRECLDCGEPINGQAEQCALCSSGVMDSSPPPCLVCRAPVAEGQRYYCSDACREEDISE